MNNTNNDNNKPKKTVRIPKRLREAGAKKQSPSSSSLPSSKQQPNVGWKFYFDYYRQVDYRYLIEGNLNGNELNRIKEDNAKKIQKQNEVLWALDFNAYAANKPIVDKENYFKLKTSYPGLLVGSGYQHELSSEDALKLGFYFDHTTGLPAIPGSGIKGTLRSAFKESWEFIQELLTDIDSSIELDKPQIEALEKEIFEGIHTKESKNGEAKYLDSSHRDVFYDAVMVASDHPFENSNQTGRFLGNDYITPHINRSNPEMSAFKNPVPLQFLKVLPEVTFCFQFDLKDSLQFDEVTAQVKLALFQLILTYLGTGAKTNVGYGAWIKASE